MSGGLTAGSGGLVGGGRLLGGSRLRDVATRRLLRVVLPLVVGLLLLALAVAPLTAPAALHGSTLAGAFPDSPIRLAVVMDVSGSMADHWASREQALRELVAWGASELRPEDTISVFVFANEGQMLLEETTMADLNHQGLRLAPIADLGGGSEFASVLPVMQQHLGPEPHIAVWITDTEVNAGSRDPVYAATSSMGIYSTTTVLPDRDSGGSQWQVAFPATHYTRINPMDPDSTGLALAQAIASATGQRVVRG